MFKPGDLFDLAQTACPELFDGGGPAWEALKKLKAFLDAAPGPTETARVSRGALIGPRVFIGENTVIEEGVVIKGPARIGANCEIRHNAYLREYVVLGDGCVVGNACEIKHSILFNRCQVPHFNYVGDSILGHRAHLGAGVKISNVKLGPGGVRVQTDGGWVETGLRKFGALVGDRAEIGCNSVLNPGSILGRDTVVYPNVSWRGVLPAGHIAKNKAPVEIVPRGPLSR